MEQAPGAGDAAGAPEGTVAMLLHLARDPTAAGLPAAAAKPGSAAGALATTAAAPGDAEPADSAAAAAAAEAEEEEGAWETDPAQAYRHPLPVIVEDGVVKGKEQKTRTGFVAAAWRNGRLDGAEGGTAEAGAGRGGPGEADLGRAGRREGARRPPVHARACGAASDASLGPLEFAKQ